MPCCSVELLESTKEGRNINRHYYTKDEIDAQVERPVVQKLFELLKFSKKSSLFLQARMKPML
ncbi:hypothetical protein QNH28_25130 [Paenibacillus sp. G2S3]|uniref:hypothetical protein n=1 Tax=Paenibacillus sp. G2S3 TaxID=3047872 RepID=UPI0024C12B0B|nr:hypothetical protein [Paenibacillus sp. G2S3]WHY22502.1 hypothetical protein QNH28_25130 [Paenibacillus sp. G2S3]